MSFLKQLLNPFIEFDADNKNAGAQNAAPPSTKNSPQAPKTAAPVAPPTPASAKPAAKPMPTPITQIVPPPQAQAPAHHPLVPDATTQTKAPDPAQQVPVYSPSGTLLEPLPEHVQYFEKLIDEANRTNPLFSGTDYKEFVDSKLDIDDIADEALKYKTAYNVLKSTGLTKEKLLSTGQEYLNLIGRDLNAFQSAHTQQYNQQVRQKELAIQKKAEELQLLAQKVAALKAEINGLSQEITVTKEKLNGTKNSFLLAGELKQKEIETELQKIAGYF